MDYEKELEKAKLYAEKVKVKQEIEDIKHSNDRKKELSFSKIAVIFIFSNCVVIELYSMYAMLHIGDLSALGALIAAVVGQCVTICSYNIKAGKENTKEGIVFETAMKELEYSLTTNEDDGAVG